jgi:hypothetical protein
MNLLAKKSTAVPTAPPVLNASIDGAGVATVSIVLGDKVIELRINGGAVTGKVIGPSVDSSAGHDLYMRALADEAKETDARIAKANRMRTYRRENLGASEADIQAYADSIDAEGRAA